MDNVLIVSSNEKATTMLVPFVREAFPTCKISVTKNGIETRRAVGNYNYDATIINCPLTDEYGNELAEMITESSMSSCIMLVKAENADSVSERVEDFGVMVVSKPISRQVFYQALKFVNASRKRILGLQNENVKLHKKLDEIKIVNRAKFALMQYLKFSEAQAHRYIEKQAMDLRCTKYDVAMKVIKMYEV